MSSHAAFVSYSREDSEFALRLAQDLKKAGAHIWLDQMDIQPGYPWDNAIEDALMDSPLMLLILSPASAKSDNVRNEISFALEQGKTVIPVLYMSCVVPLRLQRTQRIDFRSDYARGLTSLLEQLQVSRPDLSVIQKVVDDDAQRQAAWKARELQAQKLAERIETQEAVGPIPLSTPPTPVKVARRRPAAHPQAQPAPAIAEPPSAPAAPMSPLPVSQPAVQIHSSPPPPGATKALPHPEKIAKHIRIYKIAAITFFVLWILGYLLGGGTFSVICFFLMLAAIAQIVSLRRKLKATQA